MMNTLTIRQPTRAKIYLCPNHIYFKILTTIYNKEKKILGGATPAGQISYKAQILGITKYKFWGLQTANFGGYAKKS